MQKKVGEIAETFQHLKFAEAISLIDQLLKKNAKQDKKKNQLTNVEIKVVQWFKVGSLVSLGKHHQANPIFQDLMQPQAIQIMGKENPFLMASVAELFGESREKRVLDLLQKYAPNYNNSQVYRFFLSSRLFSNLAKFFLKEFMNTKNLSFQLAQVYLQYLQNLDKLGLIQFERDGWYKYHPELKNNLKLVGMFLDKCSKSAEDSLNQKKKQYEEKADKAILNQKEKINAEMKQNQKIFRRSVQLKLKIAINEGRVIDAIKLYGSICQELKEPFKFIRSILKLKDIFEDKTKINQFYFSEMKKIFIKNLDLINTYTPFYDYYHQFLLFLIASIEQQTNSTVKQVLTLNQNQLTDPQMYNFNSNSVDVLNIYYTSLYNQYVKLTDKSHSNYQSNKKQDYYKICVKGLLLQLIYINHYVCNLEGTKRYLISYTELFSNTLTYSHQLKQYWKELIQFGIITQPAQVINDNHLIQQINYNKIYLAVSSKVLDNYEQTMKLYEQFIKIYTLRVKQIQKNRILEKGERYISDQLIIILSDYIRAYIEQQKSDTKIVDIINRIINQLQFCVEASPFNADLKLRLMYFCQKINHHQRLIQLFFTNDIKSVQMETLGYWFLKPILEFGLWNHYDHFVDRMMRTYHENQRETSQYGLKALKATELDRVQQFICYRTTILSSYNSIVILYLLYHRFRFETGSQFYLIKINEAINKFKTVKKSAIFNADFKVMTNQLFPEYSFGQFYGLYNNYEVLQLQVNLYLHEQSLINEICDKNSDCLTKQLMQMTQLSKTIESLQIKSSYDFNNYFFREQTLNYNLQHSTKTIQANQIYLNVFKLSSQVRIHTILLASSLVKLVKAQPPTPETLQNQSNQILQLIKELNAYFKHIHYRQQVRAISLIRRALFQSHNLLNVIREVVAKNKKLKNLMQTVDQFTSKCMQIMLNSIIDWQISADKEKSSKLVEQRDEMIERQLNLDKKEVKRIQGKYQIVNRM